MNTEINDSLVIRATMKELDVYHCFKGCTAKQTPRVVRSDHYVFAIIREGSSTSLKMASTRNETEMQNWIKSVFAGHGRDSYADITDVFLIQKIDMHRPNYKVPQEVYA